jgi:ornithine carbamoyltransferase
MKTLKTCLNNKDFLSLLDVNPEEIISILRLAEEFKKAKERGAGTIKHLGVKS